MTRSGTRLTAIASGKGGTGKTLLAVSLAQALAHLGEHILLCDADLGLSNAGVHLGLGETGDLAGLVAGRKTLHQAVVPVSLGRDRFDLLAAPSGSGALAGAGEAEIDRLIAALQSADAYDRILIDLGAGVGSEVLQLAARADDIFLVVSPDPASITDAYAFAKLLLRRTTTRVPQLVVNMALNATEGRRVAQALTESARAFLRCAPEFLGFIPFDARVSDAVRRQTPLLSAFPQSPAATAIESLARRIHGENALPLAASGLR